MNEKYAGCLGEIVQRTLDMMFSVRSQVIESRQERTQEAPFDVSAIIGVTGPMRGSVVISFPAAVARKLTERMLGMAAPSDQDMCDCVGEFANIVAGNFLAVFDENGTTRSELSIPGVVLGPHKVVWSRKDIPYDLILFDSDVGEFVAESNFQTRIHAARKNAMSKILIVDDSRVMRRLLQSKLIEAGFESCVFLEAEDGKEALAKLEAENHDVDVVFSDLCMPNMTGLELIDALAEKGVLEQCPVIVLSGDVRESKGEELLSRGARGVLGKPFTTEDLTRVLGPVLSSPGEGTRG